MSNNIMANSSIWANSGTDEALTGKTDRLASDKHTFLKLLVAQLTNQDPLNPTEDKEFVAQLAQFTSLEQLQEINSGVDTLNTTMNQGQLMTATGFIGKNIVTNGNQVTKANDANGNVITTRMFFTSEDDAAAAQANVYDGNGNLVFSEELGAFQAGTQEWKWYGTNLSGQEVPSGVYEVRFAAQDKNGKTVMLKTQFTAQVRGVLNEDGVYKLALDGNRVVPLTDVTEITDGTNTNASATSQYVTAAANSEAAAAIAMQNAEAARDETVAATTSEDAEAALKKAQSAADTADKAAKSAEDFASQVRELAEELKTAEALTDAETTKGHAEKAREYADKAGEYAEEAKTAAEGKGASSEGASEEASPETPAAAG